MRDEDKPFICYKQGWKIQITPRNATGWKLTGLWLLSFFLGVVAYIAIVSALSERGVGDRIVSFLAFPFLVLVLIWAITMIRWMKARSEIVDVEELLRIKNEQDAKKKRHGR